MLEIKVSNGNGLSDTRSDLGEVGELTQVTDSGFDRIDRGDKGVLGDNAIDLEDLGDSGDLGLMASGSRSRILVDHRLLLSSVPAIEFRGSM